MTTTLSGRSLVQPASVRPPLSHSPPAYWIARVTLRSGAEPVMRLFGMMSRARSLEAVTNTEERMAFEAQGR